MSGISEWTGVAEHGTRAKYVRDHCRCARCRAANTERYRLRRVAIAEAAGDVKPSGPPGAGIQMRAGHSYRIKTCPGANGAACIAGGAWLKNGTPVCSACLERATVFGGLVDAGPVRDHLMELRREGIGYKSVAAACDVSHTVISEIISGEKTRLRASTAKRILGVDAKARADHSVVPARETWKLIRQLLRCGWTQARIAKALGRTTPALQLKKRHVLARTALAVEKLARRELGVLELMRRRCPLCGYKHVEDREAAQYCFDAITRGATTHEAAA